MSVWGRKVLDQLLARCSALPWPTPRFNNQYRVTDRNLPGQRPLTSLSPRLPAIWFIPLVQKMKVAVTNKRFLC